MAKGKVIKKIQEEVETIMPAGKDTKKTFSVKLGKERFGLEEFCNYKALLAMQIIGEVGEKANLRSIANAFLAVRQGEDKEVAGAIVLINLLPQLLKEAPNGVLKFAALALISNKKLAELYDTPNAIATEIQRIEKLIGFDGVPGLPIAIIKATLPYVGLDALKNALTGLGDELEGILPLEEQTPNTK